MAFSDEVMSGLSDRDVAAEVEKPKTPEQQLREYLATLPLAERRQYLASMRGEQPRPQTRQSPPPRVFDAMFDNQGMNQAYDAYNYANAMHNMQGNYLGGMANQVNAAIADEMDSRRAIAREERRMAYQKWLAEQKLMLQWGKLDNERAMQQEDAANQIRMLRYKAAQDRKAETGFTSKTLRMDPRTGQYRMMEDWEV